ncbi:MAG TPA: tetratricopeptide repeat protein, partial [Acidimicrobiales bacterium]|nr:tetratricopeptide repeat protein [Acidimicrobiales bacterium]
HQLDFFRGDATGLRDRIGRSLLSWDSQHPWFGFLLGMHAFGLEECGLYARAERAGMRALEIEPRDVWAHHAVLHVHEMEGRFRAGLRFAEERRAYWEEGNFLVPHNAWHKALFHLEADNNSAALEIYDRVIHNAESSNVALEMLDAAALLWRLHLSGADVGGRWGPLADAWAEKVNDPPWYVFNDMHATMSLVGAGRLAEARAVVDRLVTYVDGEDRPSVSNVAMTAEVGLPVCSAIVAFGEGRYGDAVRLLHPIRKIVYRFGGSHAQRDAVARTLLEAAIRGGETALARALVSERLAIKDTSPFNWLQLARLRQAEADRAGARDAEVTASNLRVAAA